jgi:hypothetical protein
MQRNWNVKYPACDLPSESRKVVGVAFMKYAGLKKLRWVFFGLAAIGIAQTPAALLAVISEAKEDHRLIPLFLMGGVIRFLFIGFFLKIWWETRASVEPMADRSTRIGS